MKGKALIYLLAMASVILGSCNGKSKKPPPSDSVVVETDYNLNFNADSAYHFVSQQVEFGPRVPETVAHGIAANYLVNKLSSYCDTAFIQGGEVESGSGKIIGIKNIIGVINPEKKVRVMLCAHWDTRPHADEDLNRPTEPADGANDGASGVGVLLEIARQLSIQNPKIGIDIIFFDAEDMGDRMGKSTSWCLGSQYWANNPHRSGYAARYGILLDMVGAKDAVFAYEGNSLKFSEGLVSKVWKNAYSLGYSNNFIPYRGGSVTDDHVFISTITGIPTIDIIHYDITSKNGFGSYWHTHDDNMDVIDKNTLKAVGETVLKTVYEERP